jgi:hypothetical protein|tara:strand:- start:483 stop:707 length:225 start_codon:yes stop_codon:yes gene_type:complete
MTEEMTTRQLRETLTKKRNAERNSVKITKNRNFDHVGPDPDAHEVKRPGSADVPDYIGKPKRKVSRKLQDSLPY